MNPVNRLALFVSQILFSIITPLLLMPKIANLKFTRSFISFCFGRSYGNRYQNIIDSFQGRYGLAMAEGLKKAREIAGNDISVVVDCGTGTGFVTRQAAEHFSHATFIAFDILSGMLAQARDNCKDIPNDVFHLQADAFALPLADESVDLLLAQNTMPCFTEFARVCRPGGMIIYVDSSAGWITGMVKRLVKKQGLFEKVIGKQVDTGFYVLAQKASHEGFIKITIEGETKQQKLTSLLRCPLDKSKIVVEQDHLRCGHHQFPIQNGFPVMLEKYEVSKAK
ncbi:MAG: methyltransferase domain-containing protein [Nitrospirota bacterium]